MYMFFFFFFNPQFSFAVRRLLDRFTMEHVKMMKKLERHDSFTKFWRHPHIHTRIQIKTIKLKPKFHSVYSLKSPMTFK